MHTIGVDLAAQAKGTFACAIAWEAGRPAVTYLEGGLDDRALARALGKSAAVAGIDVPFGWPDAFVALMAGRGDFASWEADAPALRMRATDRHVHATLGRWPLSVSSDLIAAPAMRWRILRARHGLTSDHLREVYPAAALERWGLPSTGYKKPAQRDARGALLETIVTQLGLALAPAQERLARDNADALDAIVAALIARAVAIGASVPVPEELRAVAAREGWIELPTCRLDGLR